jgi:hypothetical protein
MRCGLDFGRFRTRRRLGLPIGQNGPMPDVDLHAQVSDTSHSIEEKPDKC